MRPEETARVARRIAARVSHSKHPSQTAVQQDLTDLLQAVSGDKDAVGRLSSRLSSGIPALGELEHAFVTAGREPPEMRHVKRGLWMGKFHDVKIAIHAAPNGEVQKVLVAGKPVKNWNEAVEAALYFVAMADNGTPEDPEDIEEATEAVGSPVVECIQCHGPVDIEADFQCKKCGKEYVTCPGCNQPYPMDRNESDHCPICGYSSWSELGEDVHDAWVAKLTEAAKQATETRQPVAVDYEGFAATIEVVDKGGELNIIAKSGATNETDGYPLTEWMEDPSALLRAELDEYLWKKDAGTAMQPMKPYTGPMPAGQGQGQGQQGQS